MSAFPQMLQTVLDTTDVRGLAEFYRHLLGLQYRPGDEPVEEGKADYVDWLVLTDGQGKRRLAFQQVDHLQRTTWPLPEVPMQMHLDLTVPDREALEHHHSRALALGAELRLDRTDDPNEPLYVYADPAGHPFCIFVAGMGSGVR
ncbi:VOC family protein [Arthrobacter sp. Helios]|uniref:VOC family protein n=1 Tax=Arthrobacter sp. Helios TaxID=2828862 RepID=UPI00205C75C9|nr:VOC family protein [Arthrobacter sp. Helios]UPO76860.1 VOC family protein [Arthrobacter sp. Helios]